MSTDQATPKHGDRVRVTFEGSWTEPNGDVRCVVTGHDGALSWPVMIPDETVVEVLGEEQLPAPTASPDDELTDMMRALVKVLEGQAGACATEADLATAVHRAAWLNNIATRVLGSAVLSYANGGTIPGPPRGSHGKRAAALLAAEVLTDPDASALLDQALRTQRSAAFACRTAEDYLTGESA